MGEVGGALTSHTCAHTHPDPYPMLYPFQHWLIPHLHFLILAFFVFVFTVVCYFLMLLRIFFHYLSLLLFVPHCTHQWRIFWELFIIPPLSYMFFFFFFAPLSTPTHHHTPTTHPSLVVFQHCKIIIKYHSSIQKQDELNRGTLCFCFLLLLLKINKYLFAHSDPLQVLKFAYITVPHGLKLDMWDGPVKSLFGATGFCLVSGSKTRAAQRLCGAVLVPQKSAAKSWEREVQRVAMCWTVCTLMKHTGRLISAPFPTVCSLEANIWQPSWQNKDFIGRLAVLEGACSV